MTQKRDLLIRNSAADSLLTVGKQIFSEHDENVVVVAASAGTAYAIGYPFAYNKSVAKFAPWMAPDPTVLVIYLGSTKATGGTWGFKVNNTSVEVDVPFDDTAAEVKAIFAAEGYNVAVVLSTTTNADDTYTITFNDQPEIETLPTVVGTVDDLTGDTASTATTTDGTATNGTQEIRGFANPNVIQTGITTGDVALVVLTGTDTLCTATQTTPHGLVTGMSLTTSGATEAKLNITADITVLTAYTYTYAVAAVSGGVVDSGSYTTTNDTMGTIMTKGKIHAAVPEALVATGDVTALRTALKNNLMAKGLIIQGLTGTF